MLPAKIDMKALYNFFLKWRKYQFNGHDDTILDISNVDLTGSYLFSKHLCKYMLTMHSAQGLITYYGGDFTCGVSRDYLGRRSTV